AVVPHVGNTASAKVVPPPEYIMRIVWMVGTMGYRAEPQIPVEAFRHRRRVGRVGGPLWPYGTIGPVMNFKQLSNSPFGNPLLHEFVPAALAPCEQVSTQSCFLRGVDDESRLIHPVGKGLMNDNVLSFFHRSHGYVPMKVIRCHDLHGIDVAFLFE